MIFVVRSDLKLPQVDWYYQSDVLGVVSNNPRPVWSVSIVGMGTGCGHCNVGLRL
jgi:hypothetical protein